MPLHTFNLRVQSERARSRFLGTEHSNAESNKDTEWSRITQWRSRHRERTNFVFEDSARLRTARPFGRAAQVVSRIPSGRRSTARAIGNRTRVSIPAHI